jgi:hypothetical protein
MPTNTNGIDAVITGVVVAGSTGTDIAATAAAPKKDTIPASRIIAAAAAAATHDDYNELLLYLVREHTVRLLLTVVSDRHRDWDRGWVAAWSNSIISCAVSCYLPAGSSPSLTLPHTVHERK